MCGLAEREGRRYECMVPEGTTSMQTDANVMSAHSRSDSHRDRSEPI
jgi:hypothetical protein